MKFLWNKRIRRHQFIYINLTVY